MDASVTHIMPVLVLNTSMDASVTHIMPVLVLNTSMDANMQFSINSFRQLFPDKIFSDISLTPVKFPDNSRFSRQVVTLLLIFNKYWSFIMSRQSKLTDFGQPHRQSLIHS